MSLLELIEKLHACQLNMESEVLIAYTGGQRAIEDVHAIPESAGSARGAIWLIAEKGPGEPEGEFFGGGLEP